jgi:TatD DNase family protein
MFEQDELGQVLERARTAEVAGVLVPATSPEDLDLAIRIGEEFPDQTAVAIGIHPHEASTLDDGIKARIERELTRDCVVAIGEIGLDYHYMNSPREDQLAAFEWQLDLAHSVGLPTVIHNRESWIDLERVLATRQGRVRGVCHSFAESGAAARRVVEIGLLVGISGMVTFKAADNVRGIVAALDQDHVMVETDSPFLAPVPHRGRRNEPAYVVHTGRRVAGLWDLEPSAVAEATTRNFRKLFGMGLGALGDLP